MNAVSDNDHPRKCRCDFCTLGEKKVHYVATLPSSDPPKMYTCCTECVKVKAALESLKTLVCDAYLFDNPGIKTEQMPMHWRSIMEICSPKPVDAWELLDKLAHSYPPPKNKQLLSEVLRALAAHKESKK